MLKDKTIVVGVTGGIAAYKSVILVSELKKQGANVHVVMTKNATEFVTPLTFETRSGNRCISDMFERNFEYDVKHISLAKAADLIIVAPATANFIAKAAHGIADDMLTTVILAAKCPKLVAPAMNTAMYENPATQDNLKKIQEYGFDVIEPNEGLLACGDEGKGKMPEPSELLEHILYALTEKDMQGLSVLVTAGPTQEAIDPVRYITNHSSGKMGYEIAHAAAMRGADVTLVSGPTSLDVPLGVTRVDVTSSADMYDAVVQRAKKTDMLFKAAAVADYTPADPADHKLKKSDDDLSIALTRTKDILAEVGANKKAGQIICGFAMETEDLLKNARAKLEKKNLDIICANSLRTEGAGFAGDTNVVTLITKDETTELGKLTKLETAHRILDKALELKK
ncbi:MAG: bifunctional phosphopantothenoylcysteine decarboxylase/phosphopantothenate--cysteine ligase CoaBC [Mogibacterium sp.]|nr:bifunctional phosphopantothenoylcysteine decarboxylase/phosphopantothenate--cysteine ligase CoaBC [Mogibacterium sp.]